MADDLGNLDINASTGAGRQTSRGASTRPSPRRIPAMDDSLFHATRVPVSTQTLRFLTRMSDLLAIVAVCLAGLAASDMSIPLAERTLASALPFFALGLAAWLGLNSADVYHNVKFRTPLAHAARAAFVPGVFIGIVAIGTRAVATPPEFAAIAPTAVALLFALVILHASYRLVLGALQRNGALSETVVIVGATPNALRLIERNATTRELNIVGIFDDRLERAPRSLGGVPLLGRLEDLLNWESLPLVDRIVVTVTSDAKARVRTLIDRLRWLPNRVVLLLDLEGFNPEQRSLAEIADAPAAYVSGGPRDLRRAILKRGADIMFASALILLFSPVMLACAIAIRIDSAGPVFFRQKRHGFNNEIVRVWKFRTMRPDKAAEERMRQQATVDDERITKVGSFLRRTSLDELPQLFNVILGDMSLVGPRPHAVGMTTDQIEVHDIVSDYAHRHRVKPGITGWAQINGSRGPVHTREEVRERVRLDLEYINRSSFWFDVYIMLMTAPCLIGDRQRAR